MARVELRACGGKRNLPSSLAGEELANQFFWDEPFGLLLLIYHAEDQFIIVYGVKGKGQHVSRLKSICREEAAKGGYLRE